MDRKLTFYHAPNSRSASVRFLLEELGVPFDLHALNLKKNEQRDPAYLAVNPMGKVPALKHGDTLVTEQPAVLMYLADLFPQAGLAPALDDAQRAAYLRWMIYYGSCFEPAVVDLAMKREPAPPSMCPYGSYDTVLATLSGQLRSGPWMLGERFSAADVLWGSALGWTMMFKLVPELPEFTAYVERVKARPAAQRAAQADAELAAAQA